MYINLTNMTHIFWIKGFIFFVCLVGFLFRIVYKVMWMGIWSYFYVVILQNLLWLFNKIKGKIISTCIWSLITYELYDLENRYVPWLLHTRIWAAVSFQMSSFGILSGSIDKLLAMLVADWLTVGSYYHEMICLGSSREEHSST